jgi:hypothetical protein
VKTLALAVCKALSTWSASPAARVINLLVTS